MISVIIPTFNRAKLVVRAAQSVLNQTYSDLELIIVDDGSTDETKECILGLNDKRVRYIYQKNTGACAARNNGIKHAKGEYIAFHDSDDVWHIDKLEKQIQVLNDSHADLVFCCMVNIKNGKNTGLIGDSFQQGFCTKSEIFFGVGTQTLCARADVFKSESFDINMPRLQDFELMLRISKKFRIYYIKEPLVDYYMQNDSISMKPEKLIQAWNIIFEKNPQFCKIYKNKMEKPALSVLSAAWQSSDTCIKNELIKLALKMRKTPKIIIKVLFINNKLLYKTLSRFHKFTYQNISNLRNRLNKKENNNR